jgi:hypothetical protein
MCKSSLQLALGEGEKAVERGGGEERCGEEGGGGGVTPNRFHQRAKGPDKSTRTF